MGAGKCHPSLLGKGEGGRQHEQGSGKRLPKTAAPGQRGHSLGVQQVDAMPAGTGAAPRAFPAVLPPSEKGRAAWGHWQHSSTEAMHEAPASLPTAG